jgi:hypothetical protein
LPELHEARGKLLLVFCRNGYAIAGFSWGAVAVAAEIEHKLKELVGKEICCLRLDGKYYVREA